MDRLREYNSPELQDNKLRVRLEARERGDDPYLPKINKKINKKLYKFVSSIIYWYKKKTK